MKRIKYRNLLSLCFFVLSIAVFLLTTGNIYRLCQRIPDKMLSLYQIDMQKITDEDPSKTGNFCLGYKGTWKEDLFVNGRVYKNMPVAFANSIWLEEAAPSFSEDAGHDFFSSDHHILLGEEVAEKMGVYIGSSIEIFGETYTVFSLVKGSSLLPSVLSEKTIYVSGLPENKEVSKAEAIFGYTDGKTIYKKEAAQTLYSQYQISIPEKDIMDMQPWKKLLLESWKLWLAAVYLILASAGLKKTACRLYAVYSHFHEESLRRQIGQILRSVLQTAVLLLIWYLLIVHIDLPQQCIPPDRFLDLGFYLEKVKALFTSELMYQSLFLRYMKTAGMLAVIGYSVGILAFITACFFAKRKIHGYVLQ